MIWDKKFRDGMKWCGEITNLEQKQIIANRIAEMACDGDVIGFGSGSTSFLIANEIGRRIRDEGLRVSAIPTSPEIEMACFDLGIQVESINNVRPDWCFDGADEVDSEGNLIKGRGGCMFMEKLLMRCSPKTYIAVDQTKLVDNLGTNFAIPIEIHPKSLMAVKEQLSDLGASEITLRLAKAKDGPVITESANYILDVRFAQVYNGLEQDIKLITGVIESGLFMGYPIEVITV